MQGRGLARAGRADAQDEPIGLRNEGPEHLQVALGEPHLVERQWPRRGQDPQDHIFVVVDGRNDRDAKLDLALAEAEANLSILGVFGAPRCRG